MPPTSSRGKRGSEPRLRWAETMVIAWGWNAWVTSGRGKPQRRLRLDRRRNEDETDRAAVRGGILSLAGDAVTLFEHAGQDLALRGRTTRVARAVCQSVPRFLDWLLERPA